MGRQIINKYADVNGIKVFYREAGERENPHILLLHGFPTSSVMFKSLMAVLSEKSVYHLFA